MAPKLTFDDGLLDWTLPVHEIYARFRGVTPEPGAHTSVGELRVKILAAAPTTGEEIPELASGAITATKKALLIGTSTTPLEITRVQPAGKGPMDATDWWRGFRGDDSLRAGA